MTPRHLIIAGCQRCGTTALAKAFSLHPEIKMAEPLFPEPKFFLQEHPQREQYLTKYFNETSERILGEKSTSYIEYPSIAEKIKNILPEVKIIIMLREPASRAISNYHFTKSHNLENRSLEEVFLTGKPQPNFPKEKFSVSPFNYIERGEYIRYIESWFSTFKKKQILSIVYEEFIQNGNSIKTEISDFLELQHPPEFPKFFNSHTPTEIEKNILTKLQNHYKPYNERLASFINKDLNRFWDY